MRAAPILAAAVAVLAALGGYALTGRPGVASAPAPRAEVDPRLTPEAEKAGAELLQHFGSVRDWLTLSDALIRAGQTETAIYVLDQAIDRIPGSVDLWAEMGVALVAHAGGEVVPAARLAFDRASRIDPSHPAPPYFLGLAWLQAGQPERALATWSALAARTPPDAPWRPMLERGMRGARAMIAMGVGGDAQAPAR